MHFTTALHLKSSEFVASLKIWLKTGPCPACQAQSGTLDDHDMCCTFQGERILRHNALIDALFSLAASSGLGSFKEYMFLLSGTERRPADMLIPHWSGGKNTAFRMPQCSAMSEAATTPGYALTVPHKRKMTGNADACRRKRLVFIPLAMKSSSGWHGAEGGKEAGRCSDQTHWPRG